MILVFKAVAIWAVHQKLVRIILMNPASDIPTHDSSTTQLQLHAAEAFLRS
jgi:hypothetical protein